VTGLNRGHFLTQTPTCADERQLGTADAARGRAEASYALEPRVPVPPAETGWGTSW